MRFITRERVMGEPTLDAVQRRRRPWTPYQRIEMCGAECVVCWEVERVWEPPAEGARWLQGQRAPRYPTISYGHVLFGTLIRAQVATQEQSAFMSVERTPKY